MSGDYSRRRFDKALDFTAVLNQQGRVNLDSDWNEQCAISSRRLRAETIGTIGRAVVPTEEGANASAFEIKAVLDGSGAFTTLSIGPGRIYVDGLLAENHGKGKVVFDPVLEEDVATEAILFEEQPYLRGAVPMLPQEGSWSVYLDVWQREVTYLERPELVENAVAVDTTTRMQTAWQVKLIRPVGGTTGASGSCGPLPDRLTKPSAGRLTTEAVAIPPSVNPCLIPPAGLYRGLDNRLYRVEIHDGGVEKVATFKWSRDNAAMATTVTAISGTRLSVASVGRDSVLAFGEGDWIEVTDDALEFGSQPGLGGPAGEMARIKNVFPATLTIELENPLANPHWAALKMEFHLRIRRWDQRGKIFDSDGNPWFDVDASTTGLIPVPPSGTSLILEDGVKVTFDTDPAGGEFRTGDYWNFVARTADASVEKLDKASPHGVHHHFASLAEITFATSGPVITPCLTFWPPVFGGASCECTICISADDFNKGAQNGRNLISDAAAQLATTGGGKICLGPGIFKPASTIVVNSQASIHISGRGQSTVLLQPPKMTAFNISGGGITVEDLQVWTTPSGEPPPQVSATSPAFSIGNVFDFTIQRCWVAPDPSLSITAVNNQVPTTDPAILFTGVIANTTIRDNTLVATHGIATSGTAEPQASSINLRVLNNIMLANTLGAAQSAGIYLNRIFTTGDTRISGNTITVNAGKTPENGEYAGMKLSTVGSLTSRMEIDSNHIVVNVADGNENTIACGIEAGPAGPAGFATTMRIADNDCFITWPSGKGVGMGILNLDAFEHILFTGNTVASNLTNPNSNSTWVSLFVLANSKIGQQACSITGNVTDVSLGSQQGVSPAKYAGVALTINGDCILSENDIANETISSLDTSQDVVIAADTIVANNNRVKHSRFNNRGDSNAISMDLNTTNNAPTAMAMGNVTSGEIQINKASPPPSMVNITGAFPF